ncbi:MAG: hypothetical protein KDA51_14515 [Planctomycetales bacterium]|nr:hypothetical protein [Planctomycetales bacterium]MCA9182672.1 hypothetical protein [Planctomycetales bacterium]
MGLYVWLLPLSLWAAFAQTEVATTEQAPYPAQVLSISADGVELKIGNKLSTIPLDKLRRLGFANSATEERVGDTANAGGNASSSNSARRVSLRDGSLFGYRSFALAAETARFELEAGALFSLPASQVQHVQLQELNPAQWTQWQAIVQSRASGDTLVLIRSDEALETLEGIVSAVNAEHVSFDFGGQKIDAPLSKLAGLRLFAPAPLATGRNRDDSSAKLSAIVQDRSGNRWMTAAATQSRGSAEVELVLQGGAKLTLPVEQLAEIDFSAGSTQFLANLEPLRRDSGRSPAAGSVLPLGLTVAGAEGLFGARARNQSQAGQPALGPSLEFLGSGSISYRIPPEFTRLRGEVELRPSGNRFTPVQVGVRLENEVVWQERLSETGRRWPIDVPIEPDGRLRIEVSTEAETPVGDVVLWHDLRLVK